MFFVSLSEQNGFCHVNSTQLTAHIKSYTNVTSGDAKAFKLALYKNGPVAVSIDASHRSFVFYSHGVYYEPACGEFTPQWCSVFFTATAVFLFPQPNVPLFILQVIPLMIWTTLCLQWVMGP